VEWEVIGNNGSLQFRFLTLVLVACNIGLMVDIGFMAGFQGQDGSSLSNRFSPTLITLASFSTIFVLYSLYDFGKLWKDTKSSEKTKPFTWDWMHSNFQRCVIPFAFHSLVIWPTMLTFIIQSQGQSFFSLVNNAGDGLQSIYATIIVSFIGVMVSGVLSFAVVRHQLETGSFVGANDDFEHAAPVLSLKAVSSAWMDVLGKLSALISIASSVGFAVALIKACSVKLNSAVVTSTTLYLITALANLRFSVSAFLKIRHRTKKWWLAYRAVVAVHMFFGYVFFWVVLLLVALLSTGNKGYFHAVSTLTVKRRSLVFTHMTAYLLYLICVIIRVYFAKMRKEGRQTRILQAEGASPDLERLLSFQLQQAKAMSAGDAHSEQKSNIPLPIFEEKTVDAVSVNNSSEGSNTSTTSVQGVVVRTGEHSTVIKIHSASPDTEPDELVVEN
jgi:hypothetical protein